jgi:hypothetical protein
MERFSDFLKDILDFNIHGLDINNEFNSQLTNELERKESND